jgi:hypothetical protein
MLIKSFNREFVMLNLFQHLVKLICEETLNQVQGDRTMLFEQSINGVGGDKSTGLP